MSLSSLNSIGQRIFELESGNENVVGQLDGQTDKKRTNERTELHQVFGLESGNENVDRRTSDTSI